VRHYRRPASESIISATAEYRWCDLADENLPVQFPQAARRNEFPFMNLG